MGHGRHRRAALLAAALISAGGVTLGWTAAPSSYTNSVGMKMVRIDPGSFRMGHDAPLDAERLGGPALSPHGDWDERPTHQVRITYSFAISEAACMHRLAATITPRPDRHAQWRSARGSLQLADLDDGDWPNVSFIATRLRFGAEEWDMPSPMYDLADVNDQTSLLWNDNGMIRHFTGGVGLGDVPFRMQTSRDNASWTAIEFPQLVGPIDGFPDRFPCARQQPAVHGGAAGERPPVLCRRFPACQRSGARGRHRPGGLRGALRR